MQPAPTNSKRSPDVLRALKDHGPLSAQVIKKMISPPMRVVSVQKSLAILREKGFVRRWSLNGGSSGLAFFEIRQEPRNREAVGQVLSCRPDELIRPFYRRQDLIHHQWVEYWIYLVRELFPDAEIVRESQLSRHETAGEILLLGLSDYEVHPDFLVIFPATAGKEITSVAIEIERTRKSNERITRKLSNYASCTRVDGVIYACEGSRLADTISNLWDAVLTAKAARIRHYGDYFFLFSNSIGDCSEPLDSIINLNAQRISLEAWCNHLRNTKHTLRRNHEVLNLVKGYQQKMEDLNADES